MTRRRRSEFPVAIRRYVAVRSGGRCECYLMPPAIRRCFPETCDRKAEEFDHIVPDMAEGEPTADNCAHLSRSCHLIKTKADQADRKKRNAHLVRKDRPKSGWFRGPKKPFAKRRSAWGPKGVRKIPSRPFHRPETRA